MDYWNVRMKKKAFNIPVSIITVLLIVFWFFIGWTTSTIYRSFTDPSRGMIAQVMNSILAKAYADISPKDLTYTAIKAMVSVLGDKYAEFHDPQLTQRTSRELEGDGSARIGVTGEMQSGQFVITEVAPGLPADLGGIKTGDIIASIDDWNIPTEATASDVLIMLKNRDIPVAHLHILRDGKQMEFDIPRQPVDGVQSKVLEGQIGYLRFDLMGKDTPEMVKSEIEKLQSEAIRGLIIDLRYNGGGWMDATQKILDLFEDQGMAYYARLKDGKEIQYPTVNGDLAEAIPLVVLISHETYSASETMAASLKERGRAVLLGETTYGKGSIKENIPLADGSEIVFTVARWLSPVSKTDYEGRGVSPDIAIEASGEDGKDAVLDAAIDYLMSHP